GGWNFYTVRRMPRHSKTRRAPEEPSNGGHGVAEGRFAFVIPRGRSRAKAACDCGTAQSVTSENNQNSWSGNEGIESARPILFGDGVDQPAKFTHEPVAEAGGVVIVALDEGDAFADQMREA